MNDALIIKPNRCYRMRNGEKSEPVEENVAGTPYVWRAGCRTYTVTGRERSCGETPFDLVAPWSAPAAEKLICDVTLEDYRRGVARVWTGRLA